jgi:hypothetical protein
VAEQFLIDLANGIEGINCPNDTFETPSVFDISYKGGFPPGLVSDECASGP